MDWLNHTIQNQAFAEKTRTLLREKGRVHVPGFLSQPAAENVFDAMKSVDWRVLCRGQTTTFETTIDGFAALDGVSHARLFSGLYDAAATGFQYLYDVMRISDKVDAGEFGDNALATIYSQLNSPEGIAALRKLAGDERIEYVDARATRYRTGHFLTTHDDSEAGKQRLYGYVLNLTPQWRADWGGLLMFFSPDGHVSEAFTPAWNALNIFSVPQPHAVSQVTPYARANRYSITGWLRSQKP